MKIMMVSGDKIKEAIERSEHPLPNRYDIAKAAREKLFATKKKTESKHK